MRGSKHHQFGFFWGKSNVMGSAVVKGELEEIIEEKDVAGDKGDIICLSN